MSATQRRAPSIAKKNDWLDRKSAANLLHGVSQDDGLSATCNGRQNSGRTARNVCCTPLN